VASKRSKQKAADDPKADIRPAGRYNFEDMHRALFGRRTPPTKTIEEMKEGIRSYIRKRHAPSQTGEKDDDSDSG